MTTPLSTFLLRTMLQLLAILLVLPLSHALGCYNCFRNGQVSKSKERGVWQLSDLSNSLQDLDLVPSVQFRWRKRPPKRKKCANSLVLSVIDYYAEEVVHEQAVESPLRVVDTYQTMTFPREVFGPGHYYYLKISSPLCGGKVYSKSKPVYSPDPFAVPTPTDSSDDYTTKFSFRAMYPDLDYSTKLSSDD